MATEVGFPVDFQHKFLGNKAGHHTPLTPPVAERRRQSVDSPSVRPRPRAGSDSNKYHRLSEDFKQKDTFANGSPIVPPRTVYNENNKKYSLLNKSLSVAAKPSSTNNAPKPTFSYQKLENTAKTNKGDDDFADWHFSQPNVFLDENEVDLLMGTAPSSVDDAPQYEVVSQFLCRHDDEMQLDVDDKVAVTAKHPNMWYQGTNLTTGQHGVFPSLYVKELPVTPESDKTPSVSPDCDIPLVPKRLGSLGKQISAPAIPLTQQMKVDEMKAILEMPDITQSVPPRLSKPPVVTRVKSPQSTVKSPQSSLPASWVQLEDNKPTAVESSVKRNGIGDKDDSFDFQFSQPVQSTSQPTPTVSASKAVAEPSIKTSSLIVEDNESDYSEVKFSVLDFEKLTKKVNVVNDSSAKDEGAQAILDAAKSPVKEELKLDPSGDYEDLSLFPTTFDKLQRKVQVADVIGKKKLASPEASLEPTPPPATQSKPDDGIMIPKEVTGGLKVKEMTRTVYYAKLLGCVQVKRHRGSGALRDAIAKIQNERKAFGVQDKKSCIIEISEKGFSLHDNTDSMEPREPLMYSLFRVISCANLPGSDKVFGVYIKDAEQEVYHCYAFEADGSNREVATAFGEAFKRFYKQLMKKKASQKQKK